MPKRKFDWGEAQRLYWEEGLQLVVIADRLGVGIDAVRQAVVPGEWDRYREKRRRGARRPVPCVECGDPLLSSSWRAGARLCVACSRVKQQTTVRPDSLLCAYCREWKPDIEFHNCRSERRWHRRFRASTCRVCSSRLQKERKARAREQKKV